MLKIIQAIEQAEIQRKKKKGKSKNDNDDDDDDDDDQKDGEGKISSNEQIFNAFLSDFNK